MKNRWNSKDMKLLPSQYVAMAFEASRSFEKESFGCYIPRPVLQVLKVVKQFFQASCSQKIAKSFADQKMVLVKSITGHRRFILVFREWNVAVWMLFTKKPGKNEFCNPFGKSFTKIAPEKNEKFPQFWQ